MEYRIDKARLLETFSVWDGYLKRRVRLVACGGTAMTLLGVKASTKDIDLIIPEEKEYAYLIKLLVELGYKQVSGLGWAKDDGFIFDLFCGKRVHTTELLTSPLEPGRHTVVKEFQHLSLAVLNPYDLVISKLFRGSGVDVEDCLVLWRAHKDELMIDMLKKRYAETASYDVSEERVMKNLAHFLSVLKKEGLNEER